MSALLSSQIVPDWVDPLVTGLSVFVGGGLAYFTTRVFEREREKKHALGQAYSLITTLVQIADDLAKIERHLVSSLEGTLTDGAPAPEWTRIADIVGFDTREIDISNEQISVLAELHDAPLLMAVKEMEAARRIILQRVNRMAAMRDKLAELGGIIDQNGSTISFQFEGPGPWMPLITNLNDISKGIALDAMRMKAHAQDTLSKIGPALKSHYKFKKFYVVHFTE